MTPLEMKKRNGNLCPLLVHVVYVKVAGHVQECSLYLVVVRTKASTSVSVNKQTSHVFGDKAPPVLSNQYS